MLPKEGDICSSGSKYGNSCHLSLIKKEKQEVTATAYCYNDTTTTTVMGTWGGEDEDENQSYRLALNEMCCTHTSS